MPKYSVIIPVYNRPQEIDELLHSLLKVNYNDFEVIVIEDGSNLSSIKICKEYKTELHITYLYQENTGPGPARNKGAELASGDILVFFDSDCIIPAEYFNEVEKFIDSTDCFGGPDRAHEEFNTIQKAINYSMTSTLTTGGIRGGKKKLDKFYPRSFNLGIKTEVFRKLNGFDKLRFGEDLDFSMRIIENGYKTLLIDEAWVFHKRRNNFKSFFKQVHNSGIARINLEFRHPGTIKIVHWFPTVFTIGYLASLIMTFIFPVFGVFLLVPPFLFFIDSLIQTRQISVSLSAIASSFIQLTGYGSGFINAFIKRKILKRDEFHSYEKNFYK